MLHYLLVFIDKLGKAVEQHQSQRFISVRTSKHRNPKNISHHMIRLKRKRTKLKTERALFLHHADVMDKLQRQRQQFVVGICSKQPIIDNLWRNKEKEVTSGINTLVLIATKFMVMVQSTISKQLQSKHQI